MESNPESTPTNEPSKVEETKPKENEENPENSSTENKSTPPSETNKESENKVTKETPPDLPIDVPTDKEFNIPADKLRFKKTDLEDGKKFLKERYIKLKIKEKKEKLEKIKEMNLNEEAVTKKGSFIKESQMLSSSGALDEEKAYQKYSAAYLQIVEKAILSFNLKKYEESYNILLKSNIIHNEEEFGLILFLQNGFDKGIIGEYLPKFKVPNCDGKVLASFAQSFDLKTNKNFLDCFRFFLSRVGVPKDANLILVLVEEFTKVYYFDNKKDYPNNSPNDFYLLASTVLALNTMITRSKDIKNINMIKREEFIKMNQSLTKEDVGKIYDELNSNPIDFKQDYNEIIYKILSGVVSEKTNSYEEVKKEVVTQSFYRKQDLYSLDSQFSNFTDYEKQILHSGGEFNYLKNGPNDNNPRYMQVNKANNELQAKKSKTSSSIKETIKVDDIKNIILGTSSLTFKSQLNISLEDHSCYCTIITKTKNYDLYNKNREYANKFYKALKSLLNFRDSEKRKQKLEKEKILQEKILEIWRKEILVKWSYYRLFTSQASYVFLTNDKNMQSQMSEANLEKITMQSILDKFSIIRKDKKEYYNLNEFSFIVMKGVPEIIRQEIWRLFIGNPFHLTTNLLEIYFPQIEKVNFELCVELYEKDKTKAITSEYPANKIIKDIIKATKMYDEEIAEKKIEKYELMQNIFVLVRSFCFLRPDIFYSSCLVNICFMLFLTGYDKEDTFTLMANLIIKSPLMNFLQRDQIYINQCSSFFDSLLEKFVPEVFSHFTKLEITPSMYFTNWYETLFFCKFNYPNTIRMLNAFIFKGERTIFQSALALFSLQKDDLLILPIGEILQRFKRFTQKVNDEYLETFDKFYISNEYKNWKKEGQLGEEKGRLFQFYMNETE
ncbi:MAG: hypothetical protein MJ252_21615 [archaeon]|nr:hypothetical protein [archaeon]